MQSKEYSNQAVQASEDGNNGDSDNEQTTSL